MKYRILLLGALLFMAFNADAQWKITSVDRQDFPGIKLLQIVEIDTSAFVYATMTNTSDESKSYCISRETGVYVDGMKYKLRHSVNLPVYDEAEAVYLRLLAGEKANVIMEFERFPVNDGFDIIENDAKHNESMFNLYGIHSERIDTSSILNTGRFLETYPIVTKGSYKQNGKGYPYYLRNGIYICVDADNRDDGKIFGPGDLMFNVEIINDSDHGILVDMDNVWVTAYKTKKDGTEQEFVIPKYSPESYDQFLSSQDYEEAKRATSSNLDRANYLLKRESNNSDSSEWGKLGYSILSSMTAQMIENNVHEYLEAHPKTRPTSLKSNSIKSGESINGYVACSKKKADYYVLHVKFDDYEFTFSFK